ncbi:hypothetical protein CXB51_014224 [Gossypium anomalum]|uniref:Uncharacterized protein n=1 Tax=Gossypium anomalum TaxID=47600 RepID=A0A8J5Z2X9_9ROSI|nr:hypothetical protein CXB51_014224 [Gossypium anomalum]
MEIKLVPTQPQRDNQGSYETHITTKGSSEAASRNSQAHRLAKEALDSGENSYLMREKLNSHLVASERRRPRNPD